MDAVLTAIGAALGGMGSVYGSLYGLNTCGVLEPTRCEEEEVRLGSGHRRPRAAGTASGMQTRVHASGSISQRKPMATFVHSLWLRSQVMCRSWPPGAQKHTTELCQARGAGLHGAGTALRQGAGPDRRAPGLTDQRAVRRWCRFAADSGGETQTPCPTPTERVDGVHRCRLQQLERSANHGDHQFGHVLYGDANMCRQTATAVASHSDHSSVC